MAVPPYYDLAYIVHFNRRGEPRHRVLKHFEAQESAHPQSLADFVVACEFAKATDKSNVMCTQYVVKHNLVLDGMLIY